MPNRSAGGKARFANLTPEEKTAIAKRAAVARWSKKEGATTNTMSNNDLHDNTPSEGAGRLVQSTLFGIEMERDVNGIEMGVLENGIAYLSQRGLQRIVGVTRKKLFDITNDWEEASQSGIWTKGRISFIQDLLAKEGFREEKLYLDVVKGGVLHHAYPDVVCMAILEYYAFEADGGFPEAVENYRRFARYGLTKFIYEAIGYTPIDSWKYYHDRTSLLKDSAPMGYWIVYNETTGIIVDLINANLPVNDRTIPDISVGQMWAKHWKDLGLTARFGERIKYDHNYPDYYPQAASNPQEACAYPDESLPEFRRWLRAQYLPTKFPPYILRKANVLKGGIQEAQKIAALYDGVNAKSLPASGKHLG